MTRFRLSARLRIALWFGALFFLGSVIILSLVFALVRSDLLGRPPVGRDHRESDEHERLEYQVRTDVREQALESLLVRSGGALVAMTLVSGFAGWAVAGVVLRPVHRITDIAKRASATTLDHRVRLDGPDDELKDLADTFDGMLDRLQEGIEAQRRFAANAAHELRTPLTVIRTATEVALADPSVAMPPAMADATADIRSATYDAEQLIDKLLELARSEHGVQHSVAVDLAGLAHDSLLDLTAMADARGVRFELDLAPTSLSGDPALIDLAITNLVLNAVRYNREGGTVRLRTASGDGFAVVEVANDGAVIAPDQVERLVEPFVRGAGSRQSPGDGEGTGLGLSIVRAVAHAHGGDLHLEARPEGGLSARLRLPVPGDM